MSNGYRPIFAETHVTRVGVGVGFLVLCALGLAGFGEPPQAAAAAPERASADRSLALQVAWRGGLDIQALDPGLVSGAVFPEVQASRAVDRTLRLEAATRNVCGTPSEAADGLAAWTLACPTLLADGGLFPVSPEVTTCSPSDVADAVRALLRVSEQTCPASTLAVARLGRTLQTWRDHQFEWDESGKHLIAVHLAAVPEGAAVGVAPPLADALLAIDAAKELGSAAVVVGSSGPSATVIPEFDEIADWETSCADEFGGESSCLKPQPALPGVAGASPVRTYFRLRADLCDRARSALTIARARGGDLAAGDALLYAQSHLDDAAHLPVCHATLSEISAAASAYFARGFAPYPSWRFVAFGLTHHMDRLRVRLVSQRESLRSGEQPVTGLELREAIGQDVSEHVESLVRSTARYARAWLNASAAEPTPLVVPGWAIGVASVLEHFSWGWSRDLLAGDETAVPLFAAWYAVISQDLSRSEHQSGLLQWDLYTPAGSVPIGEYADGAKSHADQHLTVLSLPKATDEAESVRVEFYLKRVTAVDATPRLCPGCSRFHQAGPSKGGQRSETTTYTFVAKPTSQMVLRGLDLPGGSTMLEATVRLAEPALGTWAPIGVPGPEPSMPVPAPCGEPRSDGLLLLEILEQDRLMSVLRRDLSIEAPDSKRRMVLTAWLGNARTCQGNRLRERGFDDIAAVSESKTCGVTMSAEVAKVVDRRHSVVLSPESATGLAPPAYGGFRDQLLFGLAGDLFGRLDGGVFRLDPCAPWLVSGSGALHLRLPVGRYMLRTPSGDRPLDVTDRNSEVTYFPTGLGGDP